MYPSRSVRGPASRGARRLHYPSFFSAASTEASCSRSSASFVALLLDDFGRRFVDEAFVGELAVDRLDLFGDVVAILFEPFAFGADIDEAAHVDVDLDRPLLAGERAAGRDIGRDRIRPPSGGGGAGHLREVGLHRLQASRPSRRRSGPRK